MERKKKKPRKKCHSKKQIVDDKNVETAQCMIPYTERNASGRNWEIFKGLNFNSLAINSEIISKENINKKTTPHQKSKKKHHPPVSNTDHVTHDKEIVYDKNKKKLTKQIAIDCEMVGIRDGIASMLARISIVNRHGFCVYDKYVKPREPVQDYRTKVSGIRPEDLQNGEEFEIVQKEVAEILKGRILVGHALKHDLDVLYLSHPRKCLRDTSRFKLFRQISKGNTPSLKKLALELLGKEIQTGEHNSIEDARSAMQLYVLYKNKWESEFHFKL
ncbi:RNA exonuclease 4 [Melipona quadrifasciata]|uniref:RNA exonuclease 4 n=1 Tax=Melipona quadrifasciata TaxID=166423 RepID=A0A0M8ZW83_9HYME|nr:RNA exonuclease 4 [Melipona quadrifasciata]